MDQDNLIRINQGKRAGLALEIIGGELEAVRKATLKRMKDMYRAGQATEVKLLSEVAGLCVLDDLESKLRQKVRIAESGLKESLE